MKDSFNFTIDSCELFHYNDFNEVSCFAYSWIPLRVNSYGLHPGQNKGVDVTQRGCKKIGTSSVYKVLGLPYALITFLFDATKGVIIVFISKQIFSIPEELVFLPGIAAILGHNFPLWLKFKGQGRGVATSLGLLVYLLPSVTIKLFAIYILITLIMKSTAPATPVFFILLPIVTKATKQQPWAFYFTLSLFAVFIITRILAWVSYIRQNPNKLKALWNIYIWDRTE